MDSEIERKSNFNIELELASKLQNDDLVKFQQKSYFDKLAEVMGDRNVLWWFIPVRRLKADLTSVEKQFTQYYIS